MAAFFRFQGLCRLFGFTFTDLTVLLYTVKDSLKPANLNPHRSVIMIDLFCKHIFCELVGYTRVFPFFSYPFDIMLYFCSLVL